MPRHLNQLREWFELEWGHVDPFDGNHSGFVVPAPLVAIDDRKQLVGGLAFSSFSRPGSDGIAIWVNALLVAPEHRGLGIASQLVQAAELEASRMNANELFVLTDVSNLYQKLGWRTVETSGRDVVLTKAPLSD